MMTPNAEPQCHVRRMRVEDIQQVMAIAAALKDAPHWTEAVYQAALDPANAPRRVALVALDEPSGLVTGFAMASLVPPQAELETIAVKADAQRKGIGSVLIEELTGELRAAMVSEVLLEVRASNHPARAFYGAVGWREKGTRPRYYADPEEDAVLMSLELG